MRMMWTMKETMRALLLVAAAIGRGVMASDVYEYLGNGYCLSAAPPGGVRPTSVMCDWAGGAGSCDAQKCSCLVESGGQECATVCEELGEACTGFMVQDNGMYGKGLAHVCQLVAEKLPAEPPLRESTKLMLARHLRPPALSSRVCRPRRSTTASAGRRPSGR
jgi:hypothetical protein